MGAGSAIYNWLLFLYLLLDTILIFFSIELKEFCFAGCSRVSLLPNRLSSYVFFFLVDESFRLR